METTGISAVSTRDEFLKLLTTQLQYQDPIEPVKQEDFLQQLAQFATLEGVEKLNASFSEMLTLQQLTDGANLVGKRVEFDSDTGPQVGVVDRISASGGRITAEVEGQSLTISQIRSVLAAA